MSCFRADKSIARRWLSTCLVLGEIKCDVSHCCRSRFLPLTNIELSSHANDGSSCSQYMSNSVGQCASFTHQCTAANSFDSRRTSNPKDEEHLLRKDNTSKDPFPQFENLQNPQEIHVQVKSEYVGTLTTSEVMTRTQSDKHNNMFNVAANLKHVENHENIN